MTDSEIFDRKLRRMRRDRAAQLMTSESRFLRHCADDVLDRLNSIKRPFEHALVINGAAKSLITGLRQRGIVVDVADAGAVYADKGLCADEDMPHLQPAHYDLIFSIGLLDTVNDLPGALALMRRALRAGGLFLAQCAGAGSLETLRAALREIDPSVQRTHPMFDVRAAGDLLSRAGFVSPVADVDTHRLTYPNLRALLNDLRAHAATNLLLQRHAFARAQYALLRERLESGAPITETLAINTLTGWAPDS